MGRTKKTLKGLDIAHRCWTDEIHTMTKAECRAAGCPYVDFDECSVAAMIDAILLAKRLYKQRKAAKDAEKRNQNP